MPSANAPSPLIIPVPNLDQHLRTLRGVFPAPGETVLRSDLLAALEDLNGGLAPPHSPGERRGFQCFVWQQNARNGLTLLLLNATRDIVELDQQVRQLLLSPLLMVLTHSSFRERPLHLSSLAYARSLWLALRAAIFRANGC